MAKFACFSIFVLAFIATAFGQSCGKSQVPMRTRIVGGTEAKAGSHPWIISLQMFGRHTCGASLIRVGPREESDIVVTAAHCVYDGIPGFEALAGAHNFDKPSAGEQRVGAEKEFLHPQFDPVTGLNDIAIIKLAKPIKFSQTVQPICLPAPGEMVPDNASGTAAGWGNLKDGSIGGSSLLMQVTLPVVNSQVCVKNYVGSDLTISSKEMICAGIPAGGKDSCQGDSGGPFVFPGKQGYVLQGVVSFGEGCAKPGKPGIYARVSNYVNWIQSQAKILSKVTG